MRDNNLTDRPKFARSCRQRRWLAAVAVGLIGGVATAASPQPAAADTPPAQTVPVTSPGQWTQPNSTTANDPNSRLGIRHGSSNFEADQRSVPVPTLKLKRANVNPPPTPAPETQSFQANQVSPSKQPAKNPAAAGRMVTRDDARLGQVHKTWEIGTAIAAAPEMVLLAPAVSGPDVASPDVASPNVASPNVAIPAAQRLGVMPDLANADGWVPRNEAIPGSPLWPSDSVDQTPTTLPRVLQRSDAKTVADRNGYSLPPSVAEHPAWQPSPAISLTPPVSPQTAVLQGLPAETLPELPMQSDELPRIESLPDWHEPSLVTPKTEEPAAEANQTPTKTNKSLPPNAPPTKSSTVLSVEPAAETDSAANDEPVDLVPIRSADRVAAEEFDNEPASAKGSLRRTPLRSLQPIEIPNGGDDAAEFWDDEVSGDEILIEPSEVAPRTQRNVEDDSPTTRQPQTRTLSRDKLDATGRPKTHDRRGALADANPAITRMREPIRQCLAFYHQKYENADARSNWGMMHQIMVYGAETRLIARGRQYNTIAWMAGNNVCRGSRLMTTDRGQIKALEGIGLQGHQAQWLAILSLVGVPSNYPLYVGRSQFAVEDLVNAEAAACGNSEELTFTLIGLSHYLDTDTAWVSADGQAWDFPRLIASELDQPVVGAACGGTHRLMGFAHALRKRRLEDKPINGQWERAEAYLDDFVQYTYQLQNRDGSMSTNWFESREDNGDLDRKIQTTGHMVEFLLTHLPDEDLDDQRLVAAINFLLRNMTEGRRREWSIGPKGHALRSLAMYYDRVYGLGPAVGGPQMATQPRSRR